MPSRNLLSSVVVPTDFSEGGQRALERALRLPLAPQAKLTVLHVLPDDIPGKLRKEALAEAGRSVEKAAARASQLAMANGHKLTIVADVLEGDAATQIVKRARTVEADVIVLGRHGRRSLVNLLLGSTAAKISRNGDVPVLVVKSQPAGTYRRAVVAVELNPGGERLLKLVKPYVEEALDLNVIHASSVPYEDYVLLELGPMTRLREVAQKDAAKTLQSMVRKSGLVRAESKVTPGDPRVRILEEAKAHSAELIVVGTRGLKGVKRIVLGSVAEWILANASCDVLVGR
jgi:nucleotide-binding universal stress UspA family protein